MTSTLKKLLAIQMEDASPVRTQGSNEITALMVIAADVETPALVAVESMREAKNMLWAEVEAAGAPTTGDDIVALANSLAFPRARKAAESYSLGLSNLRRGDHRRHYES
jgi:hypothetical protein